MSTGSTRSGLSPDRPFPGLRPYHFEDHDFFFGRDDQIFALYRLFDHSRFVAVVGSSGSGKSSLVRAGLLPLLDKESREPTGRVWKMVQMHPGDAPIASLAAAMAQQFFRNDDVNVAAAQRERIKFALRRSSFGMSDALREVEGLGDASIVLVVDQFEELFRYAARRQGSESEAEAARHEEATQFVQVLLAASRDRTLNVYVLLTMRSDFIGDCANFRGLPEAVSASQFLVPSLTRDQREDVIRRPVEAARASIEPELVQQLLNDSGDDIDQLPVLQHCLLRVWEAAAAPGAATDSAGRRLTLAHYVAVGGVARALAQHADEIRRELAGTGLAVEQLFRSIAEIDGEGRIVRRARLFQQVLDETGVADGDLRAAIDRFRDDDCAFLTPPKSETEALAADTRIDVGHEALLRRWERVSGDPRTGSAYTGWLRAEVVDGRAYRGLLVMAESNSLIGTDAVEERWTWWSKRPRTAAWAERYGGRIEDVERLFRDSRAALQAQRERERRQAEAARDQERRSIAEAEERRRMQVETAAAREREAAALRYAKLARRTAIFVCGLLVLAVGLGAYSYRQRQVAIQQKELADQQSAVAQQQTVVAQQQTALAQQQATIAQQQTALANQQKAAAVAQQATAQTNLNNSITLVSSLLTDIQHLLDAGQMTVAAARQFLTTADAASKQFEAVEQTPAIQASRVWLLVAFADTYAALDDYKSSLQAAQDAQGIATRLIAADPTNTDYKNGLYNADFNAGDAEAELLLIDAGMRDYNAALAIAQGLANTAPADYQWLQDVAFIQNKIADTYGQQGKPDLALAAYQSALAINQKLADDNPTVAGLQRDLATSLARVAAAVADANPQDALAKLGSALSIRQTLAAATPDDRSLQSNVAATYNLMAGVSMKKKDYAAAAAQYNAALQIQQALAKGDLTNNAWQSGLAYEYVYLGDLQMAQQNAAAAAGSYQQSLTIRKSLVDIDAGNFNWLKYLADSYSKLAGAALVLNKPADALADHNAALPLRLKISAQYPDSAARQRDLISEYVATGDIDVKQNNPKDAATQYQNAAKVAQDFSSSHPGNTALDALGQAIAQKIRSLNLPPH